MKKWIGGALLVILLNGCTGPYKNDALAGDHLYVYKGYQQKLSAMQLTEVQAFPYFHEPFVTVAKDVAGNQYAVVFYADGKTEKHRMPLTLDQIVDRFESYGYSVRNDEKNLGLFEKENHFYWSYVFGGQTTSGTNVVYLNEQGVKVESF